MKQICKRCDGTEQQPCYQEKELIDYIDCICTSDNWDSENQESLKMDLWVKDMPVDQMQLFFHQTLVSLSDTFYRATQDEKMTSTMRDFCDYFAEKLELKKP